MRERVLIVITPGLLVDEKIGISPSVRPFPSSRRATMSLTTTKIGVCTFPSVMIFLAVRMSSSSVLSATSQVFRRRSQCRIPLLRTRTCCLTATSTTGEARGCASATAATFVPRNLETSFSTLSTAIARCIQFRGPWVIDVDHLAAVFLQQ